MHPSHEPVFYEIPKALVDASEQGVDPYTLFTTAARYTAPSVMGILRTPPLDNFALFGVTLKMADRRILVPAFCAIGIAAMPHGNVPTKVCVSFGDLLHGVLRATITSDELRACLEFALSTRIAEHRRMAQLALDQLVDTTSR